MISSKILPNTPIKSSVFLILRNISANKTTLDENEIKHFKTYSSSWWDETGEMKSLHSLNKLRVPFVRDGLLNSNPDRRNLINCSEPLRDFKLLDVGCGGGLLSEPLCRLGANVTGIDASKELIEIAKQHALKDKKLKNLAYFCTTVEEFAGNEKNKCNFDGVIASEIIEHVFNQQQFVYECIQCLKPGGSIFFTTLNKTLLSNVLGIFIAENILGLLPKGTHDYEKFIEPHRLQRILEDNNCQTKIIHGMLYNCFNNSWSWMSNTSICYALHAVKM